jgi:hypothetical protein|nr:MAG: hypothetical protein [Caudoviricetes sp.]
MFKENNRYLIKTPLGFESFKGIQNKKINILYTFIFEDGESIKCSGGHKFLTDIGFLEAKNITLKNTITNKKIKDIVTENGIFDVYEPISVGTYKTYFTNNVISHNCDFLGSTNTLISGEKLATIAYKESLKKYADMIVYEDPIKEFYDEDTGELLTRDHLYAMTVDVSEGKNLDYSAFSVFDVSTMPYKQVAVYRNNAIPPMLYPTVLKMCAEYYNNAHVLIEVNNNPQIADVLIEDLEYENVLKVSSGNKRAQTLCLYGGRNVAMGLKMSPLVKRIGCSTLKTLVETDKLVIQDFETISELTTFVQDGPSYKAEEGANDDLAMTLVIFGWLATQKMFKEIVDHDLRKQLQLEHFNFSEEDQLPLGELDNGLKFEHFVEGNSVWIETSDPDPYKLILKDMLDF